MIPALEASDFVTIGLLVALEGLLSADNAMVLAVLVLGLPKSQQRQALRYGILGAFFFRGLATLFAVYLIQFGWVKLAGAAYLLYLAVHHFSQHGGEEARRSPPKARPMLGLTAPLGLDACPAAVLARSLFLCIAPPGLSAERSRR